MNFIARLLVLVPLAMWAQESAPMPYAIPIMLGSFLWVVFVEDKE